MDVGETARMLLAECGAAEALARSAQADDADALAYLVVAFEPLIRNVAGRYADVSYEDAKQEAYLALVRCVGKYDAGRGIPFAAYAQAYVRGEVRTAMRREWRARSRVVGLAADGRDGGDSAGDRVDRRGGGDWGQWRSDTFAGVELAMMIDRAGLSPRERLSIDGVLCGLSSTDISRIHGVSADTAKTWKKRAVRKLRLVWDAE